MAIPTPSHTVTLDEGRVMTVDEAGDRDGVPVLYLHGTPDSRLARHPDDGLAAAAGVRLLALDRPGYGGTSPLTPPWSPQWPHDLARDVALALDTLGVDRCAVLAWSGGALAGLALAGTSGTTGAPVSDPATGRHTTAAPGSGTATAGRHTTAAPGSGTATAGRDATAAPGSDAAATGPGPRSAAVPSPLASRVAALGIVAGLVPREAYDDPEVQAAAPGRLGVIELADVVQPGDLGDEVSPMLAPFPCDRALAAEHQAEHRTAADAAELATVPGGVERMADALVEAVRPGLAGVAADVEAQARLLGVDLASVTCPVDLWYGADDVVTPPAFGRWYRARLPKASLTIVEDAAHYLAFTRWADMLTALARLAA